MVQPKRAMLILALFAMLIALLAAELATRFSECGRRQPMKPSVAGVGTNGSVLPSATHRACWARSSTPNPRRRRARLVDAAAVRAAIEEVNRVDRASRRRAARRGTLGAASRPDRIRAESGRCTGPTRSTPTPCPWDSRKPSSVMSAPHPTRFATPISSAYSLVDGALFRVPEVMVNASAIVALARSATPADVGDRRRTGPDHQGDDRARQRATARRRRDHQPRRSGPAHVGRQPHRRRLWR